MDKKAKKRIEALKQKIAKRQLQLAGAKEQPDDPDEIKKIEQEIADSKEEIRKLKEG